MNTDLVILQQIRYLEEQLLRPDVRKSASDVEALLADEFIEFGTSGRLLNKQQIIESLKNESPVRRSLSDFKTTALAPGVVLATYRASSDEPSGVKRTSSLRSSIWKLIDDRWRMVFHQGTLLKEL